jgi:hypothetical protein
MNSIDDQLSDRARNMLRAVRDGRGRLALGSEPDLYVDGIPCCDQQTVHALVKRGFLRPAGPGRPGELVAAALTAAGRAVLAPMLVNG